MASDPRETIRILREQAREERTYLATLHAELERLRTHLHGNERILRYTYLSKKAKASQQIIDELLDFADRVNDGLGQPPVQE